MWPVRWCHQNVVELIDNGFVSPPRLKIVFESGGVQTVDERAEEIAFESRNHLLAHDAPLPVDESESFLVELSQARAHRLGGAQYGAGRR
jgi:hypothetical protein